MIYFIAFLCALVVGLLLTRQLRILLLEGIKLLWLVLPALFLAALPHFLAARNPDLLWANENSLLILLQKLAHFSLMLIVLANFIFVAGQGWADWQGFLVDIGKKIKRREVGTFFKDRSSQRRFAQAFLSLTLLLSLLLLLTGLATHLLVLTKNEGLMPVSADYLADLDDPILIEGIKNNALYFKKLISEDTMLPQYGQIIKAEGLAALLPKGFNYISVPEILIAVSLFFSLLISMLREYLRSSNRKNNCENEKTSSD